jgi:hypothetical protein
VGRGKIGQPGTPWRRSSDLRLARTDYGRKQLLFVERRRILLVAVQPLFRVGLALPIEWRKGFEIMQAGSLTETRQILGDLHDTLDLAIVDLASLEASGASVIASICEAEPDARIRYSTIQNWSHNTYNLVTKRAVAEENATHQVPSVEATTPTRWLLSQLQRPEGLHAALRPVLAPVRAQRALGPRRQRHSRQLEPDQESLLHLWPRIGRVGQREGRADSCETLPGLMNLSLRWPQVAISVG